MFSSARRQTELHQFLLVASALQIYDLCADPKVDTENLKRVLQLAYGIRGVVRKTRYLYIVGQTRVHLDDVEGLGHFMELEVVMQEAQSDAVGQKIAEGLMNSLGVGKSDLLEGAYMDLIESISTNPH